MKRRRINKKKVALVIFTFIIIILVIAYLVSNIITLINTPDEVKIEKASSKDPITLLNY